jgi:hypothetical protein
MHSIQVAAVPGFPVRSGASGAEHGRRGSGPGLLARWRRGAEAHDPCPVVPPRRELPTPFC